MSLRRRRATLLVANQIHENSFWQWSEKVIQYCLYGNKLESSYTEKKLSKNLTIGKKITPSTSNWDKKWNSEKEEGSNIKPEMMKPGREKKISATKNKNMINFEDEIFAVNKTYKDPLAVDFSFFFLVFLSFLAFLFSTSLPKKI